MSYLPRISVLFKNITALMLISLLTVTLSMGQSKKDLERKKLKNQKDIAYTNKLLQETKKNTKSSYNRLLILNKKIKIRQRLINNIRDEIRILDNNIEKSRSQITSLEADLKKVKDDYAKMIYYAYKNRNSYDRLMFILAADDFNQAYKRLTYYKQYSEFRKKQAVIIEETQVMIKQQVEDLKAKKGEQKVLIENQQETAVTLNLEKQEQKSEFNKLKSKEKDLRKKLKAQQKAAAKLEKAIENIIAKEAAERARKAKAAGTASEMTPEEKLVSSNFSANKGRLPWPTERGVITEAFGKHEHPVIKGITVDNPGVDISTTKGAKARVVFDGEVRQVLSIPGKNMAVIIRHGEFLSVYSNLKEVNVKAGQKVSAKQQIGIIFTDENEGNKTSIELQIWQGTKRLNPALWLSSK